MAQGGAHVGQDRQLHRLVFVELRIVDVDVDDRRLLGEFRHLAGHTVVKTNSERQQEIGFVHRVVGVDGAVHAQPFHGLGIVFRETADAHQGGSDGDAGGAGELLQLLRRTGGDDAAAHVQDGSFGLVDQAQNFVKGMLIRGRWCPITWDVERRRPRSLGGGFLDVLGNIDNHRAGPSGVGDVKSLRHDPRDIGGIHDEVAVFDDR